MSQLDLEVPFKKFPNLRSVSLRPVRRREETNRAVMDFVADEPFLISIYVKDVILFSGRCLNPIF